MIHTEIENMSKGGWMILCDDHKRTLFTYTVGSNEDYHGILLTHISHMPEDAKGYFSWLSCFLSQAEESFSQKELLSMPTMCDDRFSKVLESGRRLYGERLVRTYGFEADSEYYRETLEDRFFYDSLKLQVNDDD
tara:strand:+ start:606 stop:1010 length:405 start_codon:yes stop_codon:yes gene_type:complete